MATTAVKKKTGSMKAQHVVSRVLIYALLIVVAALMLIPFLWMLSASFKLNKDVFTFPIEWIPSNPRPQNYVDIWTKIPLLTFVKNTAFLTIVVTILQVLTSSFAAYAFAKLNFKGKNVLFLGYIATIAVPWQAYMVPQFMMMRSWHLNNTHLAIIFLQAFSAFGVFMMKQFYEGVPTELCEAARIDGLSEYGIYARIMLPLSLPAVSTLVIFTFVNTWNDFPRTPDLPDQDRAQDHPDRPAYVHQPVLCRVWPDHGGFRCRTDPGPDRIPVPAEVLRPGRCILRPEGLI